MKITIEELMKDVFKKDPWYVNLYYALYRFYDNWISPITYYYRSKRLFVFITKGFDPKDTWNLDYSIAKYTLPRLRYLKDNHHGYPESDLKEDEKLKAIFNNEFKCVHEDVYYEELWKYILNKIIKSFEMIIEENEDYVDYSNKEIIENRYKEIEFGLKLFSKYFRNLWD